MSANTKIVVLRRKELLYTGIFAALGVLFVILLLMLLTNRIVIHHIKPQHIHLL